LIAGKPSEAIEKIDIKWEGKTGIAKLQALKNQRETDNKVAFVKGLRLVEEEEIILRVLY
jgi:hypothetical protein